MFRSIRMLLIAAGAMALGSIYSDTGRAADSAKPHPYRLHEVDLKQQVIWGSICEAPDGTALSFGGEDKTADDGISHTRLRIDGKWIDLIDDLRKANANEAKYRDAIWARDEQKRILSIARHAYFEDPSSDPAAAAANNGQLADREKAVAKKDAYLKEGERTGSAASDHGPDALKLSTMLGSGPTAEVLSDMRKVQIAFEKLADQFSAEPPPRALSPIVYEPKSKLFVVFGGDHCDYLTNDTWVFDPAARKWSLRHPKNAPPPRANHSWKPSANGTLILTGGYTYFSNTDYMGGQYIDLGDGDWTYDVSADTWTGGANATEPTERVYRTGPFIPETFFHEQKKPDAAAFQAVLKSLAPNVWTKTDPPVLPKINRDWGTAVINPSRGLILRFSGGHCAHGGTDVLQYHLSTNRWELCYPVEFPLGQLYSNTSYPDGFNFNHRPWVSGHTYQNYGVDPIAKEMVFLGHSPFGYVYNPDEGDWTMRHPLPKQMIYSGSMYDLTTTPTPGGLICWTTHGDVLRFDSAAQQWKPLTLSGEKLEGSQVDNSTVIYDSHRDRLLFFRKEYGDQKKYDGEIAALDLKTLAVSHLKPAGKASAIAIPYLCQIRYDSANDVMLVGATVPPGADGFRRTPAYDCATNKWITLKITGDDPSGKEGRNVSLGMMYDARRGLFWAVDTNSRVYVLRLDPKSADAKDLRKD